jgi:hypothetical protein
VYSCFGILNISFLPFRHPIDLLMEDEIAGEAQGVLLRSLDQVASLRAIVGLTGEAAYWYAHCPSPNDNRVVILFIKTHQGVIRCFTTNEIFKTLRAAGKPISRQTVDQLLRCTDSDEKWQLILNLVEGCIPESEESDIANAEAMLDVYRFMPVFIAAIDQTDGSTWFYSTDSYLDDAPQFDDSFHFTGEVSA